MESLTIKKIVSDHFGVPIEQMESKTRVNEIVVARQFAMALIKENTHLSLKAIGGLFGKRDHSTVIHALECVVNMKEETDPKYLRDWIQIKEKLFPGSLEQRLMELENKLNKMERTMKKKIEVGNWEKRISA